MNTDWNEALDTQRNEEREADRERAYQEREKHDEHEPTTYERAQYNEDIEQEIYERDDKLGAI